MGLEKKTKGKRVSLGGRKSLKPACGWKNKMMAWVSGQDSCLKRDETSMRLIGCRDRAQTSSSYSALRRNGGTRSSGRTWAMRLLASLSWRKIKRGRKQEGDGETWALMYRCTERLRGDAAMHRISWRKLHPCIFSSPPPPSSTPSDTLSISHPPSHQRRPPHPRPTTVMSAPNPREAWQRIQNELIQRSRGMGGGSGGGMPPKGALGGFGALVFLAGGVYLANNALFNGSWRSIPYTILSSPN